MTAGHPLRAITDEEVERFRVFGYLILRGWITPTEVDAIRSEVDAAMAVGYRHAPFDGTKRHWLSMTGPSAPTLHRYLEDARFVDTAERLLGAEVVPLVVDANRYTGDTAWHPDSMMRTAGARFLLYLEPLTASTGSLRVIPGSHDGPLHEHLKDMMQRGALVDGPDIPAVAAEVDPGDVIVFNWPLFHAAFHGSGDRRMSTVSFVSTAQDHDRVRSELRYNAALHQRAWGDREGFPYWDPTWLANAEGNPRRAELLARMHALDLFATAAAGEADARAGTASVG